MARERPSWTRRVAWRLEAFAYDAFAGALRLAPVDVVSALGGALLRTVGPLTREHRVADLNLRLAFPDMAADERRRINLAHWDNLGRTIFEFVIADRILRQEDRLDPQARTLVNALSAQGKRVICVSGHFANWEVIGATSVFADLPVRASYRRANNPYMDARIVEARRRAGIHLIAPKGKDGTRELITALHRGEILGFLNDQRDNDGVEAPFFGAMVRTAPGPARLALSHRAELVPIVGRRLKGARFRVQAYPPLQLEHTGDRRRDLQAAVAQINAFIEARIREAPEQWLWSHRRWPVETYEILKRK